MVGAYPLMLYGALSACMTLWGYHQRRSRPSPPRAIPPPSFVASPSSIVFPQEPFYFPFMDAVPGKMKMGVKNMDPDEWIEIGDTYLAQMTLKKQVLRDHRPMVWVSKESESTELAKRELLDLLVDHLPRRFPDIFKMHGDYICNYATGESWRVLGDKLDTDPLEIASLLVQEDLVILEQEEDRIIVTAGCVCFPSKWNVREKFMQTLPLVHEPVPPFASQLATSVMRVLQDLNPKSPIWRANWSIVDDFHSELDLYLPTGRIRQEPVVTKVDEVGEKMMYRVERQTLRRFPKTGAILFSIRTYQRQLKKIVDDKHVVAKLIDAIHNMEPTLKPYKSGHFWMDICCQYLSAQLDTLLPDKQS